MKKQNKCMFLIKILLVTGVSVMLTACGDSAKSESEMMEDLNISNGCASAREWATMRRIHWIESETTAESEQGTPLLFDEYTISRVFENYSWQ